MCIGIPLQVVQDEGYSALCAGRGQTRRLDMRLVGAQPPGTWVLAFLDQARAVLEPGAVGPINETLDALDAVMSGAPDLDERLARITSPTRYQP